MADTDNEQFDDGNEPLDDAGVGRPPIVGKLILLAGLALLVAVECVAASLLLPDPQETAALAGMVGQPELAAEPTVMDELAALDAEVKDQVEVDLGQFTVTAFQPLSNTTMRIDFLLYGTVAKDEQEEFSDAWSENQHRLRDQVIVTLRSSELGDLTDAGLGLIKRRILEKTNRTLGKPYLRSIIFSNFSFIEQ